MADHAHGPQPLRSDVVAEVGNNAVEYARLEVCAWIVATKPIDLDEQHEVLLREFRCDSAPDVAGGRQPRNEHHGRPRTH